MKPIKKFSMITTANDSILESAKVNQDAVMDLVKKMGYESVDELKKEKNLLSKLEALIKDFTPKQDISEDEIEEDRAEEIEDETVTDGEPKSLEGEEGSKEEDKEVGSTGEVSEEEEDSADEIEDETVAQGEPKDVEDKAGEKVSDDPEITDDVPAEGDDEESGNDVEEEEETPAATRRIMAFEDFIKEKEVTVNKNVNYHDDDEEPEDYAVPVAASADPLAEEDDEEEVEHDKDAAEDDYAHIEDLKKDAADDKEEEDEIENDDDDDDDKSESRIMSFSKFVNEAYGPSESDVEVEVEVSDEEDEDAEEAEEVTEEADNGPELTEETPDDNGIAIKIAKGDGPETAAGIAGDTMAMGEPKKENEKDGEELVTKDQPITKAPETSKDEPNVQGTVVVKEGDNTEETDSMNENRNARRFQNKGKLGYNDQFSGNVSLSKTLGDECGHSLGFDNTSLYDTDSSKTIADDALAGKYTYDDLVKMCNDWYKKNESAVLEKEIKSDGEFEEYATAILKDAHGEDFDEAKAKEVIDGLKSKYSGDYGAMVGALQSSMG